MFNNITNFFNLITNRKIKTSANIKGSDLIPLGTKDPNYLGGYQPTAISYDEFVTSLPIPAPGVQSVTDNGGGGVSVDNTNPLAPVVGFTGVFVDGTMTGNGTFGTPLSALYQAPAVDGVTITGDGTIGNPLVAASSGGAIPDNVTITGAGTLVDPLVATGVASTPTAQVVLFADLATTEALKPCTYSNGTGGVGATLTGTANGQLSTVSFTGKIDNTTTVLGQVILIKNQASQIQNGLYLVTQLGDGSNPFILTRVTDADETSELYPLQVNIFGGATQANLAFLQKTADPIIGTNNIVFTTTPIGITNTPVLFVDTVTSAPLPSCTYTVGANPTVPGVGAYLQATANGALGTINGVALVNGMRILVKDEVSAQYNGDYVVSNAGSGSAKWKLVRVSGWGSNFVRLQREWKVNNPVSTKYGFRYAAGYINSLANTAVGTTMITFQEFGPKYGNVFFVDEINGSTLGVQNNASRPFQTVAQGVTAANAVAPTTTNRALVYVRRGAYSYESIILYNNVDIYFEPGTVINFAQILDNGVSVTCNIYGKVKLLGGPLSINETFRLNAAASKVYFEFDEIYTSRTAFGIYTGSSVTIVGRKVYAETFNTGIGMTFRSTGTAIVNITEEFAAWHNVIDVRASSGKLYVTCPRIFLDTGNYYGGNFKSVVYITNNLGSEVVINGDLIVNNVAGYYGGTSGVITRWSDSWGTLRLNGNIYAENQFGVYGLGSSAASRTIVNGDVRTNNLITYTAQNSSVVFRNSTLMNWNTTTGSEGYPLISVAGNGKIFVDNCQMYSLGTGATQPNIAAFWKDTTTSEINVYNTVHSGADAIGFFIRNSTGGQPVNNVRIMNCRSTKPLDTNITDILTPTGFIQDPNIVSIGFI